MWTAFFFALFVVTAGGFFFVHRWQQRTIRQLNRAHQKIQLEERRVFDFLHGLGEALSDSSRPADLHVLIVEGALRILEAGGGALYIADRKADQLEQHVRPHALRRKRATGVGCSSAVASPSSSEGCWWAASFGWW